MRMNNISVIPKEELNPLKKEFNRLSFGTRIKVPIKIELEFNPEIPISWQEDDFVTGDVDEAVSSIYKKAQKAILTSIEKDIYKQLFPVYESYNLEIKAWLKSFEELMKKYNVSENDGMWYFQK